MRERETFRPANLGKGAWPDGIAFDQYGNLWGTMVYSGTNSSLLRPREICECCLMREGCCEGRCGRGGVLPKSLGNRAVCTGQGIAPWMASVTFGRPELRTVYIGR